MLLKVYLDPNTSRLSTSRKSKWTYGEVPPGGRWCTRCESKEELNSRRIRCREVCLHLPFVYFWNLGSTHSRSTKASEDCGGAAAFDRISRLLDLQRRQLNGDAELFRSNFPPPHYGTTSGTVVRGAIVKSERRSTARMHLDIRLFHLRTAPSSPTRLTAHLGA